MQPIISFEQFTFQYRHTTQPTLKDITFQIYPGKRYLSLDEVVQVSQH